MTRYLLAAALLTGASLLVAAFYRGWFDRLLSPTAPSEPDDEERPDSGAEPHEGATVEYADKLRAMRNEPKPDDTDLPEPDFDVNVWTVDVHGVLNDLEDAFHHDVEYLWGFFYDQLGIDAKTRMRLSSAIVPTGEWELVTV